MFVLHIAMSVEPLLLLLLGILSVTKIIHPEFCRCASINLCRLSVLCLIVMLFQTKKRQENQHMSC